MYNGEIKIDSLEAFLQILREINSGDYRVKTNVIEHIDHSNDPEEGNVIPNLNGQPHIQDENFELGGLASMFLIVGDGQPNWFNIKRVKEAGFDVFPCERYSFGWLNVAIRTQKGLIFFG